MNGEEIIGFAVMESNRVLLIELPMSVFLALVAEGERQCREEVIVKELKHEVKN